MEKKVRVREGASRNREKKSSRSSKKHASKVQIRGGKDREQKINKNKEWRKNKKELIKYQQQQKI